MPGSKQKLTAILAVTFGVVTTRAQSSHCASLSDLSLNFQGEFAANAANVTDESCTELFNWIGNRAGQLYPNVCTQDFPVAAVTTLPFFWSPSSWNPPSVTLRVACVRWCCDMGVTMNQVRSTAPAAGAPTPSLPSPFESPPAATTTCSPGSSEPAVASAASRSAAGERAAALRADKPRRAGGGRFPIKSERAFYPPHQRQRPARWTRGRRRRRSICLPCHERVRGDIEPVRELQRMWKLQRMCDTRRSR